MGAKARTKMRHDRYAELKRMLEEHRIEIVGEVQHKIRDVRDGDAAMSRQGVRDEADSSQAEIQNDIEFALLQMKAETLKKIGIALARLDEGRFGDCHECGAEIAKPRLRALPFAVRCTSCEAVHEVERQREHVFASSRGVALAPSRI